MSDINQQIDEEYKVSEFARLLDLTPETIRYYESVGIINPRHDENNRYRYYLSTDFSRLYNAKLLRSLGFALSDIRTFFYEKDNMEQKNMALEQAKKLRLKAEELQRQIEVLNVLAEDLDSLDRLLTEHDITESEPFWLVPFRTDYSFDLDEETLNSIKKLYEKILVPIGLENIAIATESGRAMTGNAGWLVSTVIHEKNTYKNYIGLDSCMANLMRPAMYGAYHHITIAGKENSPLTNVYDVTGSLCENNDKFAVDRPLPKIEIGDIVIIHDTGAHGHAMGFNYNGKLRSAELLLRENGQVEMIRRAETLNDYFATLEF